MSAHAQADDDDAPRELIIRLADDAPDALQQSLEAPDAPRPAAVDPLFSSILEVEPTFPDVQAAAQGEAAEWPVYTLRFTNADDAETAKRQWAETEGVLYVDENDKFYLDIVDQQDAVPDANGLPISLDPDTIDQKLNHLDVINARAAHNITRGDPSVTIGVIDSGVFYDHPDLENQVWVNEPEDVANAGTFVPENRIGTDEDGNGWVDDVIGYSFVDRLLPPAEGRFGPRDPDPRADSLGSFGWHGTAVSGVAVAQDDNDSGMQGVAPRSSIALLRAFGHDGAGLTRDIAEAIIYGADMGFDVLNMSFGRDVASPLMHDAIQYAHSQGTVLVGSAGNTAGDDPNYPSDYPEVISVIWLAEDGEGLPPLSTSSYGIGTDLGAPGSNVFTTDFPGTTPSDEITPEYLYRSASGSSFSAPQVSGAVALLRALDDSLTPEDIRSILTSSTVDIGLPGWDQRTAAGLLDVREALLRALPGSTTITRPAHDSGWSEDEIHVVGSSIHPKHDSYQLFYTEGTTDLDDAEWIPIHDAVSQRVLDDTLATWSTEALEDGEYTLRLVTNLTDNRTVEDRRRVRIQREPPELTVHAATGGLVGSHFGVITDVQTDQRSTITLDIELSGQTHTVESENARQRHGTYWSNTSGSGGEAALRIHATNDAGLTTTRDTTVQVPERQFRSQWLERHETNVPRGFVLPTFTDFDNDSLPELVVNPFSEGGGLGDSIFLYEWTGDDFAKADSLQANVIPRDVADTDGSGTPELLTQVGNATLMLRQEGDDWLPKSEAFIDTTGTEAGPFIGARLVDLTHTGTAQMLGHTRNVWKGRAWDGNEYPIQYTLDPEKAVAIDDTLDIQSNIGAANAAVGDFNGNGRTNMVVGTRYGHWIMYEISPGKPAPGPIWSYASNRFDAGRRFGAGDLTGDGVDNFVTFTQFFPNTLPDDTRMPPRSTYTVWQASNDGFDPVYTLPIAGSPGANGAITTANLTNDDRDEVVIAHAPYLIVLRNDPSLGWHVAYLDDRDGIESVQSASLLAGDVTGSGYAEIFANTRKDHLVQFSVRDQAVALSPPQWRIAQAVSDSSVQLSWRAPDVDSVAVYQRTADAPFERMTTQHDSSLTVDTDAEATYALRAWRGNDTSPLSEARTVRPRAPATIEEVAYPAPYEVDLRFTEPLTEGLRPEQFTYEGTPPERVVGTSNREGLRVTFSDAVPLTGTLTWTGVTDRDGTPVGQTSVALELLAADDAPFFVEDWTRTSDQSIELLFNAAVDAEQAADTNTYRVSSPGSVRQATVTSNDPKRVRLDLAGIVVGASGQITTLQIDELASASGHRLDDRSRAIQLTGPADDLDDVFVYPNPFRGAEHSQHVTVAGLPTEATVRIVSVDGRMVRTLRTDRAFEGGLEWDLEDETGQRVPSGVYYLRVEAPGEDPVMEKAAVIW